MKTGSQARSLVRHFTRRHLLHQNQLPWGRIAERPCGDRSEGLHFPVHLEIRRPSRIFRPDTANVTDRVDQRGHRHRPDTVLRRALLWATCYTKSSRTRIRSRLLGNIATFWETHKLGRVKVESLEPLTIVVYECFECGDLPYLGRPACSFDAGILEAIFSAHFKGEYTANETHCNAMGDDYCRLPSKIYASITRDGGFR